MTMTLVSLFTAFTVLSLSLHTSASDFLHIQLSTISAAPSLLPEAPSSFSSASSPHSSFSSASSPHSSLSPASPPQAMSPDISPLFPTPGSSEMSPSPSESSDMPTIPSSLSPPNPDGVSPDPLLEFSPVGSPHPASSSLSLLSSPLPLLLVFLMFTISHTELAY